MATSGNAPAAGPKPEKPAEDKNRSKDELIAKAAGAVVAGGIVWSLFKSVTRKEKSQQVHTQQYTTNDFPSHGWRFEIAERFYLILSVHRRMKVR